MTARLRASPVARVVAVVMAVHTVWIALYVATGHEARDFIRIGKFYVEQSDVSRDIVVDPGFEYPRGRSEAIGTFRGYDGQFAYFIALDPEHAHHYMDAPVYRYARIVYPALAWAAAGGQDSLVPYSMIVVNWLMVAFGTLALALLLVRRGASPWWALGFGLAPGLLITLQRDLNEPTTYAIVAGALLALYAGARPRYALAALLFALAGLSRQTTLVFPLIWSVWVLLGWFGPQASRLRRLGRAGVLFGVPLLTYAAWSLFLRQWLDYPPQVHAPYVRSPFGWLFEYPFSLSRQPPMALLVALPATIWGLAALYALARGARRPEWAALGISVLMTIVFAPAYNAYTSVTRVALGVVLPAVLLAPFLRDDLGPRLRRVVLAAGALYLVMLPVIFVYGLGEYSV